MAARPAAGPTAPGEGGRGAVVLVAESAAASAGIPKRVRMDVRALLDADETVVVVARDAEALRLTPRGRGRLHLVALPEPPMTLPERVALRLARLSGSRGLYDAAELVAHARGLQRGAVAALHEVVARHGVRTVVANDGIFVQGARAVAALAGVPVLYVVHALMRDRMDAGTMPYGPLGSRYVDWCERRALNSADRAIPVSTALSETCGRLGVRGDRLRPLHNAIPDLPAPGAATAERDLDCLYVGRLSIEKGIDTLLAAADLLPRGRTITVVGYGPLEAEVAAAASGSDGRLRFLGRRTHGEVARLFARAAVAVVPSWSEPFGFVVLEALAAGTPVIAAAVGGIPEILGDDGCGVLVAPRDPAALAAAVEALLEDPSRRAAMSAAAVARARAFTYSAWAPRLRQTYDLA